MGRQSTGNSEADDSGSATLGRRLERGDQLRCMVADHRDARTERDACLQRKTGDCDYVPPSRHSKLVLFAQRALVSRQ
jgi:hypothetical protein